MPAGIAVLLGFLGFAVFWCLICFVLSYVAGWQTLARIFPAIGKPTGRSMFVGIASLNAVQYKGGLFAKVTPEGLYLEAMLLFAAGHKPLLIPWTAFRVLPPEKIWWATEYRYTIRAGSDTVEFALQNERLANRAGAPHQAAPMPVVA